jgi:hypothetical protein
LILRTGFSEESTMVDVSLRRVVLSIPLVLIATASAWGARVATADRFDGRWSVVIITDAGSCDRAYRYGVQIDRGRVFYNGSGVALSGRVDPRGRVSVSLRSGESAAYGSGRLSGSAGEGRWRGTAQNSSCSGRWQAEREGESTGTGY